MKVALIGRYGEGEIIPGPERVARELYFQLKNKNINVTFIEYFFTSYGDYSFFKKLFGKKLNDDGVLRLGIIPLLFKLLKEQFDIIHFVNSQRFLLIILFLKPLFYGRFISTLHGFYKFELPDKSKRSKRHILDLVVEKSLIRKSDAVIYPSKLLLNVFGKEYKSYVQKFTSIPNGIGKEFASVIYQPEICNELSLIFYNAFDVSINKGLKQLVEELQLINNFKIKLFVVGIKDEIDAGNNIEIVFTGMLDQKALIEFAEGKQFVIKSGAFEPFSIFVAECMTIGVIPIICENTGIIEFIQNGFNGFIYNSAKKGSLAKLLNDISNTKYNLKEISYNASKIYDKLNWEDVSGKYISAYKAAL